MVFPCFTCDWPSCTSTITYGSDLELSIHKTDVHVAEILKGWPGSCSWPGCTSKIFFKTSKRLESHVYNIHITPLCCNEAQCDYKKPFEKQTDLERHIASKHLREQKCKCRYPQCRYYVTSFPRKDKLKLHYDTCHNDKFRCRVNHCVHGFASEIAQMKHCYSIEKHSPWFRIESGIGSCRLTSKSHFDHYQIKQHLKYDHKMSAEMVSQTMKFSHVTRDPTGSLTLNHLPAGVSGFEDCESCVQKLKESASGEDVEQNE